MMPDKKGRELFIKLGKAHALIMCAEILRIGNKLKNEYLVMYYRQVKSEIEKL